MLLSKRRQNARVALPQLTLLHSVRESVRGHTEVPGIGHRLSEQPRLGLAREFLPEFFPFVTAATGGHFNLTRRGRAWVVGGEVGCQRVAVRAHVSSLQTVKAMAREARYLSAVVR